MSADQVLMNEKKVMEHVSNKDGFCVECGAINPGPMEPDAVNYECEECGEKKVVGFETALLYDWVIPSKSAHPMLDKFMKE